MSDLKPGDIVWYENDEWPAKAIGIIRSAPKPNAGVYQGPQFTCEVDWIFESDNSDFNEDANYAVCLLHRIGHV